MIVCPSCSARQAAGSRYCSSCGEPLRRPCPGCGQPIGLDATACPACGWRRIGPRGFLERKTVTVLFADVVGSTAVGERLDVESHQALMSIYFEAMRTEVEALGGSVEQFVGDAVLAVFGVPIAGEDDADRAIEAGQRMLDRLVLFNERRLSRHGLHLEIRIGINTGEVVTPASGSESLGELAGDTLNVASRLAGHADPGAILVSGSTARMARRWRFGPAETVDLRGRNVPIPAFPVSGIVAEAGSGMPRAPMTGRAHEAAVLDSILERAVSERRPHLVTVYGAAGIGKSRLTAEFTAAASRREPPARVLFGRCRPYGEAVAFGALAEVLASLAGIGEGRPTAEAADAVAALVDGLGAPAAPPDNTATALAYAAGIGDRSLLTDLPAPQIRAAIGGAWRWLLERLAAERPLVVVLEDMHWADPALLDVLERLADTVEGSVVFVCPARPGLLETRPSWGSGRANFTDVTLEPLPPSGGLDLVGWYLGPRVAEAIGERIVERAEGNPYFIEEIVRGLVDEETVVRSGSDWVVARNVGDLEIPATVQAVISSRIDRLDLQEKRVLQAASIMGRTFWADAVGTLLGIPVDGIGPVLESLIDRELVLAGERSTGTGERSYRFRHALVRDVAYRTLSRRDRSRLHLALAEWLRGGMDTAPPEVIALEAHHLSMAFDGMRGSMADDVDVEALRDRAMGALLTASDSALSKGAVGQAVYFARQARRHSRSPTEASRAAEALGQAHFFAYHGDAAWRALREAIDLRAEEEEEEERDPEIARLCARALQLAVRWPGAMQARPDEITVLRYLHLGMDHAPPGTEDSVRLMTMQGFWQHAFPRLDDDPRTYLVSPEASLRSGEGAVAAARAMGRPDLESAALDAVAGYYIPRGFYAAARPHTRRRLELIGELDDLWEIGDTYAMQGWVEFHLGDYRTAERWSDEGYERTVDEAPSLALQCLRWRSAARFRLGDWDGVRRDLALVRDLLGEDREDPPDYVSPAYAAAALVHEYRGEHVVADALLDVLSRHYERRSLDDRDPLPLSQWAEFVAPILARRGQRADARRLLSGTKWRRRARLGLLVEAWLEVAAEAGNWEDAPRILERAREVAEENGSASLALAADAFEGRLAAETGELERSMAILRRSAAGFGRIGADWDAARARLALARAQDLAGFEERAAASAAGCLPVLERLGARREIDAARELVDPPA